MPGSFIPASALSGILSLSLAANVVVAAPRHSTQTAEENEKEIELLKEIQNPLANLINVSVSNTWEFGIGPANAMRYTAALQPIVPFKLNENWHLIMRTSVPMIYAEATRPGERTRTGLGDITQTFFVSSDRTVGRWIWGAGPSFLYPSASEHGLGGDKWAAGPTLAVLRQINGWTYGVIASHLWSFAGGDDLQTVKATSVAPFVSYITKRLTSVGLNVGSVYDWRAREQTVPVELSATQVLKIGGQNVSFRLGGRCYVEKAAGGPDWALNFTVSLLFPK